MSKTTTKAPSPAKAPSKRDQLIALLKVEGGTTLDAMVLATGWPPHTTRAALTGLKKAGHVIEREKTKASRAIESSRLQRPTHNARQC